MPKRGSAPARLGARPLSINERRNFQTLLNNLALGNSPVPSRRASPKSQTPPPNSPKRVSPNRGVSPKARRTQARGGSSKMTKAAIVALLALGAVPKTGYRAGVRERVGGASGEITSMMPYYESTAVNIPLPGSKADNASGRMLFVNKVTKQPPEKKGPIRRTFNRFKSAFTRPPKKISMDNLKEKFYAGQVRSGAGRKVFEVLHIHTLPSTQNVINNPKLYTSNVVALAINAFKRGNKVFTRQNFENRAFTPGARAKVAALQRKKARGLKKKALLNLS